MKHFLIKSSDRRRKLYLLKRKIHEEIHDNINKTVKAQSILQKQQKDLKEENNLFLNSYSIATSYIKGPDPFSHLKNQYTQRGYKIPNLSLSSNIFNPNPLLIGNDREIQMYYNINTTIPGYSHKPKNYLIKVQKELNQRLANTTKKSHKTIGKLLPSRNLSYESQSVDKIKNNDLIKEAISINQYNKSIENLIREQYSQRSKGKQTANKVNTSTVSKFKTQSTKNNKRKCLIKQSFRTPLPTGEKTNDYYRIDTSTTDVTRSALNSQERNTSYRKQSIIDIKFNIEDNKGKLNQSNSPNNEKKMNITSRRNSSSEKISAKDQQLHLRLPLPCPEKVFESKQKFFEYLREIGVESLTQEAFLAVVKKYLKTTKDWKEESIHQYLHGESFLDEINRLVADFNKKISLYDIVGCIPDKSKTASAHKVIKLDSIARKLPKLIIQRAIRGTIMKNDE